jgi:hypothetical protein
MTGPTAAIAWIRAEIQRAGLFTGYRQLLVRFAGEAETATLYNGSMLYRNVERTIKQSPAHSVAIGGHDPLSCAALLAEAFEQGEPLGVPVVVDCDGQRPDSVGQLARSVTTIQVQLDGTEPAAVADRAIETLCAAAAESLGAALSVSMLDRTTDSQVLRLLEQVSASAPGTNIVIHSPNLPHSPAPDARFAALLEAAATISRDVRFLARLPAAHGQR